MRLVFVYNVGDDVGSAQTIRNYGRAARALGNEAAVYRVPNGSEVPCSLDVGQADLVVFVLEWWLDLDYAGRLNLARLLSNVPRERRIVLDNDGMYNDPLLVDGDFNHEDEQASRARIELFDSISDVILQPTLHPLRPNVRSFLFHGYSASAEVPLDSGRKAFGMFYVGNNWFRWKPMRRVLEAVTRVREDVGAVGIVGHAWDPPASWLDPRLRTVACHTDPAYLRGLGIKVMPAVSVDGVIRTMGQGVFNPVLQRPVFNHLRLVNPRMFETPSANTIPVFNLDPDFVTEIYGEEALELVLPAIRPEEKIREVVRHPGHFATVVGKIRSNLRETHSYERRIEELIALAT